MDTPSHTAGKLPLPDPRMEGVEYTVLRLNGAFLFKPDITPTLNLYFVRRGRVLFESDNPDARRVLLSPNACVALSARIPHTLRSAESESGSAQSSILREAMGTPDKNEAVQIVCGSVPEETLHYVRAFQDVPIIFPDAAPGITESIRRAVDWIEHESNSAGKDKFSGAIIRRMAEIISMQIGRFASHQQSDMALYRNAANTDKRILRALTAMHHQPESAWTLESLAKEAGMSRTAFSERYRELMGTTPMQGLQRLRLRRAADVLVYEPSKSIEQVAASLGYHSTAVFIRAFTREYGAPPGRWRHNG